MKLRERFSSLMITHVSNERFYKNENKNQKKEKRKLNVILNVNSNPMVGQHRIEI